MAQQLIIVTKKEHRFFGLTGYLIQSGIKTGTGLMDKIEIFVPELNKKQSILIYRKNYKLTK